MPASYDLRERKRTRTRLMIQADALRLFAAKGYANTTVEEIADAAAISPSTFFRYFPTKEDVVLWDEYDPMVIDLIDARPAGEAPAQTCRAIIRDTLAGLYSRDREQLLGRVRLLSSVPELRARFLETQDSGAEQLARQLAKKRRRPTEELRLRVVIAAMGAAVTIAIDLWQKGGGKSDLLALFDQAVDALIDTVGELQPSSGTPARPRRATPQHP